MDEQTPKNRGGRPKGPARQALPEKTTRALTLAVASGDEARIEKAVAQSSQTPAVHNRIITDEMLEVVLVRIASGETLRAICADEGWSAALVRKRAYDNPEWGERFREARQRGADSQWEEMLEVARDPTLPVAERRLIVEVLDKMAKVHNRGLYGDKVQHDVRQVVINLDPLDDRGLT